MAPRRTSSRRSLWPLLKVVGVLGVIALVIGYLYGSMALDLVLARNDEEGHGLLRFFGFDLSSLVPAREATAPAQSGPEPEPGQTEPPPALDSQQGVDTEPQQEPEQPPDVEQQPEQEPAGDSPASLELFRVQLGSFASEDNARRLRSDLTGAGFDAFVTSGPPYRVWLGISPTRKPLEVLAQRLQKSGFETYVAPQVTTLALAQFAADDQDVATVVRAAFSILDVGARLWSHRLQGDAGGEQQLLDSLAEEVDLLEQGSQTAASSPLAGSEAVTLLTEAAQVADNALRATSAGEDLPPGYLELLELEQQCNVVLQLLSE